MPIDWRSMPDSSDWNTQPAPSAASTATPPDGGPSASAPLPPRSGADWRGMPDAPPAAFTEVTAGTPSAVPYDPAMEWRNQLTRFATFGLSDPATAAAAAVGREYIRPYAPSWLAAPPEPGDQNASFSDLYTQERERLRRRAEAFSQEHPYLSASGAGAGLISQMALGGLATGGGGASPATVPWKTGLGGGLFGGAAGGTTAATQSSASDWPSYLWDIAKGTGLGAAAGTVLAPLGSLASNVRQGGADALTKLGGLGAAGTMLASQPWNPMTWYLALDKLGPGAKEAWRVLTSPATPSRLTRLATTPAGTVGGEAGTEPWRPAE